MSVFAARQLIRVAAVMHTKNTASYWREYTVKTVLRIGDYSVEKPVILVFQKNHRDCIKPKQDPIS